MWLTDETFHTIVTATPLVSIDLVVQNSAGEILLGQRLNRPAQGFWFVPGGRIQKDESLDQAFRRLTLNELGQSFERDQASLLDIYEHFYPDSVFADEKTGPSTHYVVLGYQLRLPPEITVTPPVEQHAVYRWWQPHEIDDCEQVHDNTRAYLQALD